LTALLATLTTLLMTEVIVEPALLVKVVVKGPVADLVVIVG
jgi:hypothetical protein